VPRGNKEVTFHTDASSSAESDKSAEDKEEGQEEPSWVRNAVEPNGSTNAVTKDTIPQKVDEKNSYGNKDEGNGEEAA
jgi:hypothetical protein